MVQCDAFKNLKGKFTSCLPACSCLFLLLAMWAVSSFSKELWPALLNGLLMTFFMSLLTSVPNLFVFKGSPCFPRIVRLQISDPVEKFLLRRHRGWISHVQPTNAVQTLKGPCNNMERWRSVVLLRGQFLQFWPRATMIPYRKVCVFGAALAQHLFFDAPP